MNTVADGFTAEPSRRHAGSVRRQRLYLSSAVLIAGIAFLGFTSTYWAPLATGGLHLHPAIHVHAALFFLWTLFFIAQTALVANGRTAWHRELGLAGIALAALMVFSGILAAVVSLQAGPPGPRPEAARASAALSFSGMTLFTAFVALGMANIKRPERHKRLMVLAAFSLWQPPIARLIRLVPAIALPERILLGTLIVDLLLLAIVFLDRRSTGRVHSVWVLGGAFLVTIQYVRVALLRTDLWRDFTLWLAALGAQ